ncbi:RNA polymerase sigma-70 factor [Parabacteroides sp. OttesenSCG-928-O15]|nr:RNA polymerase sigma-70 factor [Parabacteroides sp. OttesenSCG-928-O15]
MKENTGHTDFEKVYLAYFSKMKYFARVYVHSEQEAENIVQDVFIELWERKEIVSLPINLTAYLFTSVKNKCLNHLRHQVVQREAADQIQEAHLLKMQASINSLEIFDDQIFSEENIKEIVEKALNTLPEKCRRIFVMNKIEGRKQKEIAAELNISLNTVETQMSIAYKKLKNELKDFLPVFLFLY